jgi:hypothetical protein
MNWRTVLVSPGMLGGGVVVIELPASVITEVASR